MQLFLLLTLVSLGSAIASAQDLFPLIPGSQWLYRSDRFNESLRLEVGEATVINGKQYHWLRGYAAENLRVRHSDPNVFVYLDATSGVEKPLFHFGGQNFASPATTCQQSGMAIEKMSSYEGPLGSFPEAKSVAYTPGICADTGLTSELFVPYLGLVRRSVTSFTGERNFDLVYAQIGGITYLSQNSSGFAMHVTPVVNELAVRLTLTHRLTEPLNLVFPSSQIYSFVVRNERGDVVYNWSADKLFLAAIQRITVRGEQSWIEKVPTAGLPAGQYSLEGSLVNSEGGRFNATVGFRLP